ncbi:MAG: hypothetical protein KA371_21650 [Acidobacteria bacterium]|nr:hypothetical protein [Acidobacteriota bacterium]
MRSPKSIRNATQGPNAIVRYVVWVHLARMPVPADQGSVRYVSPRVGFWVLEL